MSTLVCLPRSPCAVCQAATGPQAQRCGRPGQAVRVLRVEASVTRLSSVEPLAGGTPGRPLESSQDREGGAAWQHHSSHDHAAVAARTGEGVYREDPTPLRSVALVHESTVGRATAQVACSQLRTA